MGRHLPEWIACMFGSGNVFINVVPGDATPGPSSRPLDQRIRTPPQHYASGPPSAHGTPKTNPLGRLTPIPEVDLSDRSVAVRAWNPWHRDAYIERQVKIRGCLDLTTVLMTVPDYYRGVFQSIASDINVLYDDL